MERLQRDKGQECLTPPSLHKQDPATIMLNVSKQLIVTSKTKRVLSIEAGLEMIALGLMIFSMVCLTLWHLFQPFGLILSSQEWWEVSRNGWPCQKFLDEVWIWICLIILVDYWTLLSIWVDQMEPQVWRHLPQIATFTQINKKHGGNCFCYFSFTSPFNSWMGYEINS